MPPLVDEAGRKLIQNTPTPLFRSLWFAIRHAAGEMYRIWGAAKYNYQKARRKNLPHLFEAPMSSPSMDRLEKMGEKSDGMIEDSADIELYRNQSGKLFTEGMVTRIKEEKDDKGKVIGRTTADGSPIIVGEQYTLATRMTVEEAEELVSELELTMLDDDLDENEQLTLKVCRRMIREERGKQYSL